MTIKAIFSDIKNAINNEFGNAKNSIYIAVAWFTDNQLINQLIYKLKEGIAVELILAYDDINFKNKELVSLKSAGAVIYIYGDEKQKSLMHNKFSIIDQKTVITGSYNYSYQARNNSENIIISRDENLANEYALAFNEIKSKSNQIGLFLAIFRDFDPCNLVELRRYPTKDQQDIVIVIKGKRDNTKRPSVLLSEMVALQNLYDPFISILINSDGEIAKVGEPNRISEEVLIGRQDGKLILE